MSVSSPEKIDWVRPLQQVAPFIAGRGGVVLVSGFPTSAANTFVKLVRHEVSKNPTSLCVSLDFGEAYERYPDGILANLEQAVVAEKASVGGANVLTNNAAGRDMSMTNVFIGNRVEGSGQEAKLNLRRAGQIIKAAGERGRSGRVALFCFNYYNMLPETASWFWKQMWEGGLNNLTEAGLLIVCEHESPDGSQPGSIPPEYTPVHLPASYESADRELVREELTACIIRKLNNDPATAQTQAETLLVEWMYYPAKLHSGLSVWLAGKKNTF